MPKKKVAIGCLGTGKWMEFTVNVPSKKKREKVQYKEKEYNLDTIALNAEMMLPRISILAAKGVGMPDHVIRRHLTGLCQHGKGFFACTKCSRKKGTFISR